MLKPRQSIVGISASLLLLACAQDNSEPASKAASLLAKNAAVQQGDQRKNDVVSSITGSKQQKVEIPLPQAPMPPTRSELRVINEQTQILEDDAKEMIKQFDANLANPQVRSETEAKFRKLLPEYKEKMLLLGKAKLEAAKANSTPP